MTPHRPPVGPPAGWIRKKERPTGLLQHSAWFRPDRKRKAAAHVPRGTATVGGVRTKREAPWPTGCGQVRKARRARPMGGKAARRRGQAPNRQRGAAACHGRWPARSSRKNPGGAASRHRGPARGHHRHRPVPKTCHGCCTPPPSRARPRACHGPAHAKWRAPGWTATAARATPPPRHAHAHRTRRR